MDRRYLYFGEESWNDGLEVLKILLENGYCAVVRNEEHALVIEYEYENPEIAYRHNYWLNEEEADYIDSMRRTANENNKGENENDNF